MKWKGGDHLLITVPHGGSTLTAVQLASLGLPPPSQAQISSGLEDWATPDSIGMRAMLGEKLGFAAATCIHIRNGVLSVEFLDGDVLGGVPAEYGGLLRIPAAAFLSLQRDTAARETARVHAQRESEAERGKQAQKQNEKDRATESAQSAGGEVSAETTTQRDTESEAQRAPVAAADAAEREAEREAQRDSDDSNSEDDGDDDDDDERDTDRESDRESDRATQRESYRETDRESGDDDTPRSRGEYPPPPPRLLALSD